MVIPGLEVSLEQLNSFVCDGLVGQLEVVFSYRMELDTFEIAVKLRIPERVVVNDLTGQSQTIFPEWRRCELNTRFADEGGFDSIPAGRGDVMSLVDHQVAAHINQRAQGGVFE
ncbi:hypothetical protein D3C81_754910 [compost metagenome]